MNPPELRALDGIHLATAVGLAEDLEALITYDRRLRDAAAGAGLRVWTPA
jgi:uncharacterized protein